MRLLDDERSSIVSACHKVAAGRVFRLYLFGSRTKSALKGEDIDLLMVVAPADLRSMQLDKHRFLYEIKTLIGEQKIDLIITTVEKIEKDEFLSKITERSLLL